jgi:hypothetical protein
VFWVDAVNLRYMSPTNMVQRQCDELRRLFARHKGVGLSGYLANRDGFARGIVVLLKGCVVMSF